VSRLAPILAGFRSADHDEQRSAEDSLADVTPLTAEEAAAALRAAADELPAREDDWEDSAGDLAAAAVTGASEELVPVVQQVYARLPTPWSRTLALRLLANVGSREAVRVLARLLAAPPDPRSDLGRIWWESEPRHVDLVMPALLAHLGRDESRGDVFDLAVRLAASEPIAPEHAAVLAPAALAELRALRPRAREAFDWNARDLDGALDRRNRAERALTMIGHAPPSAEILDEVERWTSLDAVPAAAAVAALLRLRHEPDPSAVARVAADREARRSLFNALRELNRLDLVPPEHRTQDALAESELVEWLTYPAELGRPPAEIEFAEVISAETDDGLVDLYVFRFRADAGRIRRAKWFAGVAGPYRRRDAPTTERGGMTFSAFEQWDDRSPLDHAELVAGILESWRQADR
jgi:hypothetical protein